MYHELQTDFERANYLRSVLASRATGEFPSDSELSAARSYFHKSKYASLLPAWLRSCYSLGDFWAFIKPKFGTYAERRKFIAEELNPLLEATERGIVNPVQISMDSLPNRLSESSIQEYWHRCIERVITDPEGAITAAKTLLETTIKHLCEDLNINMQKTNPDLPELYSALASQLNLSPKQHNEKVFKQILSGCNSIVGGLGEIRNLYGDAHGKDRRRVKPETRHAKLAVNLAGAMALFLIETSTRKGIDPKNDLTEGRFEVRP